MRIYSISFLADIITTSLQNKQLSVSVKQQICKPIYSGYSETSYLAQIESQWPMNSKMSQNPCTKMYPQENPSLRTLCSKPTTEYKQKIKMRERKGYRQTYQLLHKMTAVSQEGDIKLKTALLRPQKEKLSRTSEYAGKNPSKLCLNLSVNIAELFQYVAYKCSHYLH